MILDNILRFFRKEYNVYAYNLKEDSKHLIQFSNKEKESIYYLQRLLDSKLEDHCPYTKDENSLIEDYLNNREHTYKIENSNFDENTYIKNNSSKIYKMYMLKK